MSASTRALLAALLRQLDQNQITVHDLYHALADHLATKE